MKVLITGSEGQLGKELAKTKPNNINLIALNKSKLDLSSASECKSVISKIRPDYTINCAAFTNVDQAEVEKELAIMVNGTAVGIISEEIKKFGGKFIQISTDYVFNGKKRNIPYQRYEKRDPIGIYGVSKAKGEEFVEEIFRGSKNGIIIRTSWLMGPVGKNFARTMLNLHSKKDEIKVIYDQIGSPTSTSFLAKAIWKLVNLGEDIDIPQTSAEKVPIFHISNSGLASWYDISVAIGKVAKNNNLINREAKVIPISSEEYSTLAKRPNFSVLETNSSLEILNINHAHWYAEIEKIIKNTKII